MRAMTDEGFVRPGYAALLEEQITRGRGLFGEDADFGEASALGKFIRLSVYDLAAMYEEMEGVYLARFPHMARGVSLDRLTPFAGVHRAAAMAAVYTVRLTGAPGATLPEGFLLATAGGVYFATERAVTLNEQGEGVARVACTQRGTAGNLPSADICVAVKPVAGLYSVVGVRQETPGAPREDDVDLRKRFDLTVRGIGSGTASAIRASVLRLAGVSGCQVVENDAEETSLDGIPPHSFACYVLAEDVPSGEIARAIFEKKPLGIKSCGSMVVMVTDASGRAHEVRYFPVETRALWLKARLHVGALFPKDGGSKAAVALSARVNVLSAGEGLPFTALYPVLYAQPGVVEASGLLLSRDGGVNWTNENLQADPSEALRLAVENVALEVQADVNV